MTEINTSVRLRVVSYVVIAILLMVGYVFFRGVTWQGSTQLHTLMETVATFLALIVGIMLLVRYYSQKSNMFLFIGTAFVGTAMLDGYHAIVTSSFFASNFPSAPSSLIPWSWIASRVYLSFLLWFSWLACRGGENLGTRKLRD